MKKELKFSIQSLLSENKEGNISGPMSPILFAKDMAKEMAFKFNRLARVWFEDEEVHQIYEGRSLTGHDTLIIGSQHTSDLWLSLWIDIGVGGISAAMCFQSDREIVMTPLYEKYHFELKLTQEEISQIFEHVFNNPQIIDIHPYKG